MLAQGPSTAAVAAAAADALAAAEKQTAAHYMPHVKQPTLTAEAKARIDQLAAQRAAGIQATKAAKATDSRAC
jgi:hypothetical protein